MTAPAISARQLGKLYEVSRLRDHRQSAREAIVHLAKAPLGLFRRQAGARRGRETFWALRGVSFDIQPGEVVGIIGRNGAGKTTLLRVLSRITEPTEGEAVIDGRVGSLLEVGTGFHPELSGRENIYLSASILGMSRAEVRARFDQIVAFAGVERFIETPIKHYSTGMYLRLAFAVAAHLEAEILFVDEVLAVGDLEFQRRCLGRMQEVSREGRTVLFVSHNMAAVEALCEKTMVLEEGRLTFLGPTTEAIRRYVAVAGAATSAVELENHPGRPPFISAPVLSGFRLLDVEGRGTSLVPMGGAIDFEITLEPCSGTRAPYIGIGINAWTGQRLCTFNSAQQSPLALDLRHPTRIVCRWRDCLLLPGRYSVELWVKEASETLDVVRDAASFDVVEADVHGTGKVQSQVGVFEARAVWTVHQETGRASD